MRSTFFGMKSDSHLKNTRIALKTADVNFLEIFLNFYKEIGYAESDKARKNICCYCPTFDDFCSLWEADLSMGSFFDES